MGRFRCLIRRPMRALLAMLLAVTSLLATCVISGSTMRELAEHTQGADDDEDRDPDPSEEGANDGAAVKGRHGSASPRGVWLGPQRAHLFHLRPVAPCPLAPPTGWPQPHVPLPSVRLLI